MNNYLLIGLFNPVVEIQMWNIGTDQNEITAFKTGQMTSNVPVTIRTFYKDKFKFRVEMPEEKITQIGIYHKADRTASCRIDMFQYCFHSSNLDIICLYH